MMRGGIMMKTDGADAMAGADGLASDVAENIFAGYESSIARIILFCLTELPKQFGQKKICDTLSGSHATFVVDHNLHKLKTYGALAPFTRAQLYLIVDTLIEHGLVAAEEIKDFKLRVLAITDKGRSFLGSGDIMALGFNEHLFSPVISKLSDRDFELFHQLRRATNSIAQGMDVPGYVVLAPRAMLEMAFRKPQTPEQLLAISGIRKDFAGKFGAEYLPVIREFVGASKGLNA